MRKARASIPFTRNSMDSNSARTSGGRLGHPEFDSDPLGSGPSEGTRASGWFAIQEAARQCIGTKNRGPRPSRGDRQRRAAHTAKRKPGAHPGWTNLRLHGWRGLVRSSPSERLLATEGTMRNHSNILSCSDESVPNAPIPTLL
jgi:hypothetical protein